MSDTVVSQPATNDLDPIYAELAAPFDETFKDTRGGAKIEYVTGEQVITRLNTVLGVFNWRFVIVEDGVDDHADEIWVRGKLSVRDPGSNEWIDRDQYGSQKIHRPRPNCAFIFAEGARQGEICNKSDYQHPADHQYIPGQRKPALDIGFDRKGAGTDCLKKCASLVGVALYLSHKEGQPATTRTQTTRQPAAQQQQTRGPLCATCNKPLPQKQDFADGTTWTQQQLVDFGTKNFNAILCIDHLRARREEAAAKAATAQSA